MTYLGVREVRVAAVNDDVTLLQERKEELDKVINRLARHDQHHDATGLLQRLHHFLKGLCTDDLRKTKREVSKRLMTPLTTSVALAHMGL